nr:hypothetical protein Cbre_JD11.011 [Caenorhabditis brenneri]
MKSVALITGPALVAAIVKNEESAVQWRIVLCILGGVMITANTLALCVFTDKPAEYTMANANEKSIKYEVKPEKEDA